MPEPFQKQVQYLSDSDLVEMANIRLSDNSRVMVSDIGIIITEITRRYDESVKERKRRAGMKTFHKFGFYVAFVLMWAFLVALIVSNFKTIEFRDKYEAQLSAHVKDLRALNRCNSNLDMTIDLYTSNGNTAIMNFYCDRWKKYQEKRLINAQ